MDLIEQNKN